MRREVLRIATKPMYLFCMIIAPLLCYVFFATLMSNGLPTDLPAGVVDLDNTSTTRNIIRNLEVSPNNHCGQTRAKECLLQASGSERQDKAALCR